LKQEQDRLNADIRDVYADVRAAGLNKQATGQLVAYLRKRVKDGVKFEEQSALFEEYRTAYEQNAREVEPGEREVVRPDAALQEPEHLYVGSVDQPVSHAHAREAEPGEREAEDFDVAPAYEPVPPAHTRHADVASAAANSVSTPHVLRPLCKRPECCAGYGSNHCHSCRKAVAAADAGTG